MSSYVAAIDQGTSSTRCLIFNHEGVPITIAQREHTQCLPQPGWVEHDVNEIWHNLEVVVAEALAKANITPSQVAALGITNQRETVVLWDRFSGEPLCNALVWQDTRSDQICRQLEHKYGQSMLRNRSGLPISHYFSGPKIRWLLNTQPALREAVRSGRALAGTMDSYLAWRLTGGPQGGIHITDVTNASRTMLMNLNELRWDPLLLEIMDVPRELLPELRPSSEVYAEIKTVLPGVPLAAILGDQQAALFGELCFEPGQAKNTYGSGCFVLMNSGAKPAPSRHGLVSTVAYKLGNAPAVYALEGSISMAGALLQWLVDSFQLVDSITEVEQLASSVSDNGGVYLVPAFSGLFAPHWDPTARGLIVGLTSFAKRAHVARAALEATAFQTREVIEAMALDAGFSLSALKVDGGMTVNEMLMQFQADILNVPVQRARTTEVTALGAAYAAGLAVGYWQDLEELRGHWQVAREWNPQLPTSAADLLYARWQKAVGLAANWLDDQPPDAL